MTTIYLIADNNKFENPKFIRKESFNNVPCYSMTDMVKVKEVYDDKYLGEMSRDKFFELLEDRHMYAYMNIDFMDGFREFMGYEDWTYIHSVPLI